MLPMRLVFLQNTCLQHCHLWNILELEKYASIMLIQQAKKLEAIFFFLSSSGYFIPNHDFMSL
jgi:hypothetical protein